jgi:hypothetical protein
MISTPITKSIALPLLDIDRADHAELATIPAAAALMHVTTGTVYRWIRLGRVKTRRVSGNGRLRIEVASLYTQDEAARLVEQDEAQVESAGV